MVHVRFTMSLTNAAPQRETGRRHGGAPPLPHAASGLCPCFETMPHHAG